MGNRGTTPSWDDEQIAKYGLFAHFRMVAAPHIAERARRDAKSVEENLPLVLALMPDAGGEDQARVAKAIPMALVAQTMPEGLLHPNWREIFAGRIYDDWRRRTEQEGEASFFRLSDEKQKPFLDIVDVVTKALEKKRATDG